jgi:cyclophilin family peptidyl-prolyl cis-trans isomerase
MRFLPVILAFIFVFTNALRATDFPTVKAPLPEINVAQSSAIPVIDLQNHFEVTSIQGPVVQIRTSLGGFNLELFPAVTPATVPNFLNYVNGGRYVNTFIHRSDKSLGVIQGGGYTITNPSPIAVGHIATDPPVVLEYNLPNVRGTIAMARTSELNSGTSEWFINTKDNTTVLGQGNGGGYAVFGRVTGTGMTVVDAIATLPTGNFGGAFGTLPVINYSGSGLPLPENFVNLDGAESVPIFPTAAGQRSVVSFSVTNNTNPTLVTATVSGSSLNLTLAVGHVGVADLTVTATDTNGNAVQSAFHVNVTGPPPEIVVEQPASNAVTDNGSRSFPLVSVGSTADLNFTIKDTGDGGLLLTGTPKVVIDGPDAGMFAVTSQPASSVAALGGSTTFMVRFAPTSGGIKTATLHIANSDSDENPFDINLTGTGNARPALTLPASPVTTTATSANGAVVSFVVTANDEEDGLLTPTVVPPSGSAFAVGDTTVQVSVTDSNGAQTTGSFTVRVLPQPPEIAVEQPAGDDLADGGNRAFPVVHVGSTADLNFTIKNVGGGNVALTGNPKVVVDGADAGMFAVIAQPASAVAASGSTTFIVRFAPTSAGLKSAALHIVNNDTDENPFDINLTGTGNARPILTLPNSPVIANRPPQMEPSLTFRSRPTTPRKAH